MIQAQMVTKLRMCYNFSGPEAHHGGHLDFFYTILQKQSHNWIPRVQISGNKAITHDYNPNI